MHADEYRSLHLTRQQIVRAETTGAACLSDKEPGIQEWELERQDLRRRFSSVHASLNGVKEENDQLRKKLEALRQSKTMKAGRAVASPLKAARKTMKRIRPLGRQMSRQINDTFSSVRARAVSGVEEDGSGGGGKAPLISNGAGCDSVGGFAPATVSERKTAVLEAHVSAKTSSAAISRTPVDEFREKRNSRNFERAVDYYWYNLGSISDAQAFIDANPEWVEKVSDKTAALIRRVAGARRLQLTGVPIPARSRGAAYVAEPKRLMYCVHSTPAFNSNGYSTRTRGVAQGIAEAGGDVVVVARSGYPWDSRVDRAKPEPTRFTDTIDDVLYVHNPGPDLSRDALDHYINEVADTFVREATFSRPNLIQSASNHRTALPALIAARRVGVPFVYEVRGMWELTEASTNPGFEGTERFEVMKKLETLVAAEADRVLAITQEVADELVKRGIQRDKISVVPNAVDPNEFVPIPRDKRYAQAKKYDPETPTIGFAGSFVAYEGLDLLLEASARLTEQEVQHQVVLAGSGIEEEKLRERATSLGLENVHFLGRLPQRDIVQLMSTFDIVACPRTSSIVTEMVSPLKPLESFATSTATVVSDVSPNRTLAGEQDDRPRALTFPAGDVEALTDALRTLIEEEDFRRDLGRTSRLWVVRERNWKMIGDRILSDHRRAREHYCADTVEGHELSELKVGVIADEFTRTSLQATFDTVLIDRENWRVQLDGFALDFLFVESAWEGNHGQWHRGVGYYSDEENADLFNLLEACEHRGIPTVFWNKEDPVHFQRFAPTAAHFDHVFTTDANMISKYRELEGSKNLTVSSHAFYAQPRVHNPLPSTREFTPTVAYAGTYYGDRYEDRSRRLDALLDSAYEYGIDIYDRQADNPESPYEFPAKYQRFVRGALPYNEVIETYKTHLAHMNVNSVENSPTMFSRRVVEIPASGGVLMSAEGRGISETLGSVLATSNENRVYNAWLYDWATNPNSWFAERWLQMRAVFRAHTSATALSVLVRTIGIPSVNPGLPGYALTTEDLSSEVVEDILTYSVLPYVVVGNSENDQILRALRTAGIEVIADVNEVPRHIDWLGVYHRGASRTFYEDLLTATTYGDWTYLDAIVGDIDDYEAPIAAPSVHEPSNYALVPNGNQKTAATNGIILRIPTPQPLEGSVSTELPERITRRPDPRVLIAGHDLKFIASFVDHLRDQNVHVETDQWAGHDQHEASTSLNKLAGADVVMCEWGLGNAVWYSRRVENHQKLIVRVHSQELFLPYLSQINHDRVDAYVFVGELVRKAAVISHGVPEHKTIVIPNGVDADSLNLPKTEEAARTLGFVGMIPQGKRIDLALDLLEKLLESDSSYRLRVKGKMPSDYPWMQNRAEELAFYERQIARADDINERYPGAIIFDGFGDDMPQWYQKIGIALSTSDFESFHFTLPDGAASGAQPVSLNWPGADLTYPEHWLAGSIGQLAEQVLQKEWTADAQAEARTLVKHRFDDKRVFRILHNLLMSGTFEKVG